MRLRIADFAGLWHIRRDIDDRVAGRQGTFRGTATLRPQGAGLWVWHETGWLRFDEGQPLRAERRYLWREDGERIAVLFGDGRPFHDFVPGAAGQAAHWCDPDDYRVQYDFAGWPDWQAVWTVRGPRKDYRMTGRLSRDPGITDGLPGPATEPDAGRG